MRRSNCSAPIPPGHPRVHHFFCCCPGVLISLIFTCPALYDHQNHPFFECLALFYHKHIFSDPVAARGGGGMGAEQFDRRIIHLLYAVLDLGMSTNKEVLCHYYFYATNKDTSCIFLLRMQ